MNEPEQTPRHPVSLVRALRTGFRAAYDNLGYVVLVSLGSFVIASALFAAAAFTLASLKPGPVGNLLLVPVVYGAWLCAVGVFYYVNKLVYHEQPVLMDTFRGIARLFWPATGLLVLNLVFYVGLSAAGLALAERFQASQVKVVDFGTALLKFHWLAWSILCGYLTLAWAVMSMYHLPLLMAQLKMESGPRIRVVLRKSFLLTVDNPGFTVGLFLAIIAFTVLCRLPAFVGIAMVYLGTAAFLLTHALRELFIKYGIVEEEPEIVEEKPWRLPE